MRVAALAAALCCAAALASAQYGPPKRKPAKPHPHAPLPPLEQEEAPPPPPPPHVVEPQPLPSVPVVSSSPPPDNSIEPQKDYWWMASGGSIFSQPGPAPPLPPQGCGGGGGGCGGGSAGGCGGGAGGGCGGGGGSYPNNPFLSGSKPSSPPPSGSYPNNPFLSGGGAQPAPQRVTCTQPGHVCVAKELCRNGIVVQDGRGLFDQRSGQCDLSTHVCCYAPAPQQSQPGCTGPPGQFVCGGLGPDDSAPTPAPSQPGLIHVAPGSRPRPGGGGYGAPTRPAQPGLVHIAPGQAATQGVVHIKPAQPGLVHIAPGSPAQPGSVSYTPGQPAQPGSVSYTPGQPAQPGTVTYTPGQPAQAGSVTYTVGQPAQPGSAVYTPGRPGTSGVPIGGSIYDATTARSVNSATQRPYTGPLNTTPYPGCAAALKCVPEELCSVEGVMTDTPVRLTPEQYESRVPLTECSDPETGRLGKCCRDPNYKDPWPGGMMMMTGPGAAHVHHDNAKDECGPTAACLHPYQCADGNKVIPIKGCRVPLDGASGMCCHLDNSASPAASAPQPSRPTAKPGGHYYTPQPIASPSQPPAVAFRPPQPAQPGSVTYTPGAPAVAGSATYTPGAPAQPGSVTYTPGKPAQRGTVSYQPGAPAVPGQVAYQPGKPAQPGLVSYHPGSPAVPDQVAYQPGKPAQPGSVSYQPGTPAVPDQVAYQPGKPAQPGSVSYQPGTPAVPDQVAYQPPKPAKPARPGYPQPEAAPSTQAPVAVAPNNPGGPTCGLPGPIVQQGQAPAEAAYSEFPWHALVSAAGNGSALCSGALVSPRAVVTSASCIEGLRSSQLVVRMGVWRLLVAAPAPTHDAPVAACARHPQRDAASRAFDTAVLVLARDVPLGDHINPICLPPPGQDTSYQRNCVASGWGKQAVLDNQQGAPLHKVPVTFVPHAQCEQTLRQTHLGKYFILHRSFQCAVPNANDFCLIDAGGPVGCDRGDGRYLLAGVYSWDVGCSNTNNPGVLGGVDVTWIQSVLNKPVKELAQQEEDEFRHQELIGQSSDTDTKPGFSQGYGRK